MRDDGSLVTSWARIVDALFRGERFRRSLVRIEPTPPLLQSLGLTAADLAMVPAKIVRARREHPDVRVETWRDLPNLVGKPRAVVPSARRDGSLLVVRTVNVRQGRRNRMDRSTAPLRGRRRIASLRI